MILSNASLSSPKSDEVRGSVALADYGFSEDDRFDDHKNCDEDIYNLGILIKELCPEYGAIARRCIGPVENRPKDTTALLNSLDRHDRIPKIILSVAGVALAVVAGLMAAGYIGYLNHSSNEAREKTLALSAANQLREKQVKELNDSLEAMSSGIVAMEGEMNRIKTYNKSKKRVYLAACGRIDKCIDDFDKNVFPMFKLPEPAFYDSINSLHRRLQGICATSYNRKLLPEFLEDDAIKFHDEMISYYLSKFSENYIVWQGTLRNNKVGKFDLPKHRSIERKNEEFASGNNKGEGESGGRK